jgi:TonB family protein
VPKIIRKSGGVLQGSATRRVEPVYPPLAKAARVSGAVVVEMTIDEEGNVMSARAISGHPLLKDAAVEAARGWTFSPTLLQGVSVKVIGTITFNFTLVSKEEIEAFKEKVNANPTSPKLHYSLAELYSSDVQYERAIEEYKQALTLDSSYVEAYIGLGESYAATDLYEEAIAAYKLGLAASVNAPPGFSEMLSIHIGYTYLKLGRDEDAAEAFKRAVAINPDSVEGHYNLGLTYLKTGDKQSAMNEYLALKNLSAQRAEQLRRSIGKFQ